MNVPRSGARSMCLARRLMQAARRGTPASFASQIRLAETEIGRLPSGRREGCTGEDERVELLGALVEAMRLSVARSRRQIASAPEGFEVHLRLLSHLAS